MGTFEQNDSITALSDPRPSGASNTPAGFIGRQEFENIVLQLLAPVRAEKRWRESGLDASSFQHTGNLGKIRIGQERHNDANILGQAPILVHRIDIWAVVVVL